MDHLRPLSIHSQFARIPDPDVILGFQNPLAGSMIRQDMGLLAVNAFHPSISSWQYAIT